MEHPFRLYNELNFIGIFFIGPQKHFAKEPKIVCGWKWMYTMYIVDVTEERYKTLFKNVTHLTFAFYDEYSVV